MIEIATLVAIFVLVSLWEYCMFFYRQGLLPNATGYSMFSVIQWVIITIALIKMFGWLYGTVGLILCMVLLQYVTHFTLGIIYNSVFNKDPRPALALFAIMVWVTGGLTVVLLIAT